MFGVGYRVQDVDVCWSGSVSVAAEAPRDQMFYGTSWLTGRVSGNHRARVAWYLKRSIHVVFDVLLVRHLVLCL